MQTIYSVLGVCCERCRTAIAGEMTQVTGVDAVQVDLDAKRVMVTGTFDDRAVRDAIDTAGYDIAA